MINIETGYKPEFALGALYQGQNAANAQSQNDEELIRMFLANQHSIQNDPILENQNRAELVSKRYGAKRDQAKMDDPQFIPQLLAGEKGQQQVTEASGAAAKALLPFKIKLAEAVARGDIDEAKLKGLFAAMNLQAAQPPEQQPNPDATIPEGFSMPNPGVSNAGRNAFFPATPTSQPFLPVPSIAPAGGNKSTRAPDSSWIIPGNFQKNSDTNALGLVQQEAAANPGDAALQKDLANRTAQLGNVSAPVFSNMAVAGAPAPTQVASNSNRDRVLNVIRDTPEQRNKVDIEQLKIKASEAKAKIAAAAAELTARIRAAAAANKPLTTVEAMMVKEMLNNPALSDEDRFALGAAFTNAKNQAKNAGGTEKALGTTEQGSIGLVDRPVNPPVPSSMGGSAPTVQPGALSDADAQAKNWALSHPNDPRAKDVLKKVMAKTQGK